MVRGLLVMLRLEPERHRRSGQGAKFGAKFAAPDTEDGRFSFHKVDEGFLRLDTRTGQVSLCNHKNSRLGLRDHSGRARGAGERDRAAADRQCGAEEGHAGARIVPARAGQAGTAARRRSDHDLKLPTQADIDRVMTFMEKVWRRMIETAHNLQKDLQGKL